MTVAEPVRCRLPVLAGQGKSPCVAALERPPQPLHDLTLICTRTCPFACLHAGPALKHAPS